MSAWMRNTVIARRAARTRFIVAPCTHMDISFSTTTVRILQEKKLRSSYLYSPRHNDTSTHYTHSSYIVCRIAQLFDTTIFGGRGGGAPPPVRGSSSSSLSSPISNSSSRSSQTSDRRVDLGGPVRLGREDDLLGF